MFQAHSIHIGVDQYSDQGYAQRPPRIPGALRDAEHMRDLVRSEGFVTSFWSGEAATREAIRGAFRVAAETLVGGDLLVVTFSGHGKRVADAPGPSPAVVVEEASADEPDEPDGEDEAWCLFDGPLLDDEVHELLAAFAAGVRIYVVSDSCFSGTMLRDPARSSRVRASVILLAACAEDDKTFGNTRGGRFTDALCRVWSRGVFRGDHRQFHRAIQSECPSTQVGTAGPPDPAFMACRPFSGRPARPGFVPPLKVHLCWAGSAASDIACADLARDIYGFLHRPIADDPVTQPGVEIPVELGRDLASLLDSIERPTYDAAREAPVGARVVVLLLDQAGYREPRFRQQVQRAVDRWRRSLAAGGGDVLVPVLLDDRWASELGPFGAESPVALQVARMTPEERRWSVPADIAGAAGRALLGGAGSAAPRRPKVFISYAHEDGAEVAKTVRDHLKTGTRVETFFDANDVQPGQALLKQVADGAADGVLLVVRTDRYSESPWCRLELLAAKQARVPIVTLLATRDGEQSPSAYSGNHRTLVWRAQRSCEVSARCVQAWLHGHYFGAHARAALAHANLPSNADVIARPPELLDFAHTPRGADRRLLVYPDPPLPEGEAAMLRTAHPAVRLMTPNTMLGRVQLVNDPSPPLANLTVGFSLSDSDDLIDAAAVRGDGSGLTRSHLHDLLSTIVLTTLHTGARLAYGGDFRRHGFTANLATLHQSRRRLGPGRDAQLTSYLHDQAVPDDDGKLEYAPVIVADTVGVGDRSTPVGRALLDMQVRAAMAAQCDARILIGGKRRPAVRDDDHVGYLAPWSGSLEEAWRTLDAGRAFYLVGGYGGIAALLVEALLAEAPPGALTATGDNARLAALTEAMDVIRQERLAAGGDRRVLLASETGLLSQASMVDEVRARWLRFRAGDGAAWNNGLTVEQNLTLFRSRDTTEVAHLIFMGLSQLRAVRRQESASTGELDVVLYHGDITSVSDVDGYAVTITPGLPASGALAALDAKMSGRLGRSLGGDDAHVAVRASVVETDDLAGRMVLVARLELPPPGETVDVAMVDRLACEVAGMADRKGLASLATTAFGASLGSEPGAAVVAMLAGLKRGRGGVLTAVVVCETNAERYQAIRAALKARAVGFRELREAGPRPTVATAVVLQVAVSHADDGQSVEVRAVAFDPQGRAPVVPSGERPIAASAWQALKTRPRTRAQVRSTGAALAKVLGPEVVRLLVAHVDKPTLLVTDLEGSGLPWEMMHDATVGLPVIGAGVERRLATIGVARPPLDRAATDGRLRVLLVVNPTCDLDGAEWEGEAVEATLRRRSNVIVEPVKGQAATVARVLEELRRVDCPYDVLHYAGHACFDPRDPGRSGLVLADGMLTDKELGNASPPRLVVLSACESARVRANVEPAPALDTNLRPLAEALLMNGAQALVGTFFSVRDRAASLFAAEFYEAVAAGQSVGDAVLRGRRALYGAGELDWGNFVLYGDGSLRPQ
ncbi:MAG: CHAT domain-containing protein [Kofleriaceae bacterium]